MSNPCCPHWVTSSICLIHVIYTWPICANSHPGNWNYITYSKSVMLPQDRAMPQATSNKCTGVKIEAVVSDTCLWSWTRHSHHSSSPTGARVMRTSHPMAWYYPVTVLTYTVRKKVNTNVAQTEHAENVGCTCTRWLAMSSKFLYFTTSHVGLYIQRHICLLWTF